MYAFDRTGGYGNSGRRPEYTIRGFARGVMPCMVHSSFLKATFCYSPWKTVNALNPGVRGRAPIQRSFSFF